MSNITKQSQNYIPYSRTKYRVKRKTKQIHSGKSAGSDMSWRMPGISLPTKVDIFP